MADALLANATYDWGVAKSCGFPIYGVKVSFFGTDERVDVYFCFKCGDLAVAHDGEDLGRADFNNRSATFVKAVKELFPNDEAIQSLKIRK
jgi:hypothetical protein